MDVQTFLQTVITSPHNTTQAYMKLLHRGSEVEYVRYNGDLSSVLERVGSRDTNWSKDTYFSPHLYDESRVLLSTRTVALDIDTSDIIYLPCTPSVVVNTSPNKHQVYIVFDEPIDELVTQQIASALEEHDPLSTPIGSLFRLPDTINTKYPTVDDIPYKVSITKHTDHINRLENLIPQILPMTDSTSTTTNAHDRLNLAFNIPDPNTFRPRRFIEELHLSPMAEAEWRETSNNPRASLRRLILELHRKGVPRGIVYAIAFLSANNHFSTQTYNAETDLKKLILYLESIKDRVDQREIIDRARNMTQTIEQRRDAISTSVQKYMRENGVFSHMRDNNTWYVPSSQSPILLASRERRLLNYLDKTFGLNASDSDTDFTVNGLITFASTLPRIGQGTTLAYYDRAANRLLISTGATHVYSITPTTIETTPNGTGGVILFPMDDIFLPFMPRDRSTQDHASISNVPQDVHWSEILFGPVLDHILSLSHEEARAVLSSWLLFLFFKSDAAARPLLAVLGTPGSGKSTIMKRVCTFLYGKVSGFMTIGTKDDYDQVTSMYPLVVIDNLDTWERWIPDSLAQSAGAIDRGVRKLYTNSEMHIYHRDAIVALTAHDPKFSRADVADRLLILPMQRLTNFLPERELMRLDRPALWYAIFKDLQHIISLPQPQTEEQLRVQDFVSLGSWIAQGLDLLPEFLSAVTKLKGSQKAFALEADQMLVSSIIEYTTKSKSSDKFKPSQQLYLELDQYSNSPQFSKKYKTAQILDNKLWIIQDALRSIVDIQWTEDAYKRRAWKIVSKTI